MSPRCRNCGSFVSQEYVRVFSRDGEGVDACPADECDYVRTANGVRKDKQVEIQEGSA